MIRETELIQNQLYIVRNYIAENDINIDLIDEKGI